jgi:alpha-beta hydrolase superfamily lysophospholipase
MMNDDRVDAAGPQVEHRLRACDGVSLFAQAWAPNGFPKAAVCLVHGLGDHSGLYRNLCDALLRGGYAVSTFDLRGHDRSDGRRGDLRFDDAMGDIELVLDETRRRFGLIPRFLYGHSLGGLLVLHFALQRRPPLAGVVAVGPPLRTALREHRARMLAVHTLGSLLPSATLTSGLDATQISRDPNVVAAYQTDPLVHSRASLGLARDVIATSDRILADAHGFPLPLLLMHGGADPLTYPSGSRLFAERIAGDCTLKVYDGLYHEIHNEPERQQVFADLLSWLDAHAPAQSLSGPLPPLAVEAAATGASRHRERKLWQRQARRGNPRRGQRTRFLRRRSDC